MDEFVDLIENGGDSNNYYMTANNTQKNIDAIKAAFKDVRNFGKGRGYRAMVKDDPAFSTYFWMGPKGVFTPLHHDFCRACWHYRNWRCLSITLSYLLA